MEEKSAYAQAGVDIAAAQQAKTLMRTAVESTYGPEVLSTVGAFGGLFSAADLQSLDHPVLVGSTDGVGTKTMVAARLNSWETIGFDIVNHCLNDILVQGARPLFFLDYVASSALDPEQIATVVTGIAAACRAAGCALLGGETAEMPGVYQPDQLDLVGTIVGVVDRHRLIDGSRIQAGDVILGLPSSGLHTNGYSLARRALNAFDWHESRPDLDGETIGALLLAPHRSYLPPVQRLLDAGIDIRGLAHITGGGLVDNPPRIFPSGLGATINRGTWPEPTIFTLIQEQAAVPDREMFHVFNMGLGMLVVVPRAEVKRALDLLDEVYEVGRVAEGVDGVDLSL